MSQCGEAPGGARVVQHHLHQASLSFHFLSFLHFLFFFHFLLLLFSFSVFLFIIIFYRKAKCGETWGGPRGLPPTPRGRSHSSFFLSFFPSLSFLFSSFSTLWLLGSFELKDPLTAQTQISTAQTQGCTFSFATDGSQGALDGWVCH